ncbi:hypothetical protein [Enterobacter phage EspM4VN]|uniref:Uncharacterized protein n=1 Tax=Enterobacter phage EspM4VN TaxID=2137745 RepID=A0A4P2WVD3_9CAUD|nr:hypothetical protein HYP11_gp176 [Enterobacter phage EspM4VN]BBK03790.1 hypothetical protein [Enterobacter phage EspM4VN]
MADIQIVKVNEVRMRCIADLSIREELNDYFKFEDPNFVPNPSLNGTGLFACLPSHPA